VVGIAINYITDNVYSIPSLQTPLLYTTGPARRRNWLPQAALVCFFCEIVEFLIKVGTFTESLVRKPVRYFVENPRRMPCRLL
jgi:hypothetical protein